MILSIAHASTEDADRGRLLGIWSDIVVGERPPGLVDCYLLHGEGEVYVHAVWVSLEAHEQAIQGTATHPAYGFFEACGFEPTHTVLKVIGRLH